MEWTDPAVAARDLRRENWNVEGKIRFPVDPFRIAQRMNLDVREVPLEGRIAGFLLKKDPAQEIRVFVNEKDSELQRRFTLAHQLGHITQHRTEDAFGFVEFRANLAWPGPDTVEVWANRFAEELLMPKSVVTKRWAEGRSAEELAGKFKVPVSLIGFRLRTLHIG